MEMGFYSGDVDGIATESTSPPSIVYKNDCDQEQIDRFFQAFQMLSSRTST
jgi:hypothetical protein